MKDSYIKECENRIAALLRAKFYKYGSEEHIEAYKRYIEIKQIHPFQWLLKQRSEEES